MHQLERAPRVLIYSRSIWLAPGASSRLELHAASCKDDNGNDNRLTATDVKVHAAGLPQVYRCAES